MAQLNTLLEDLRSEAEFDSVGHFSLDKKKAREKMKKYQLIDPHYYVLEIIQAAVASGATKIDVYLDADDCIITFDGEHYTREDLDNLYSSLFVSQKDLSLERFRELAIGINSAQALNPAFISVVSGDGTDTVAMQVVPGREDTFVDPGEVLKGTRIHVRERVSWKVASKFFSKYITQQLPTEAKVIRDRCIHCPLPIMINGRIVNPQDGKDLENVLCKVEFNTDSARGVLGIPRIPSDLSRLELVKWGVSITTRNLRLSFIPMTGVVHGNGLIKNASQSDIVENEIFKQVLSEVKDSIDQVIIALADDYVENNAKYDMHRRLMARDYLLEVIEARFRAVKYKGKSPLLTRLASVELFETTGKKLTSLEVLTNQMKKLGYLPFSRKYFHQPHPDGLVVLYADDEKKVNFLGKVFSSRIRNVEEDFFRIYIKQKAEKQWEARRGNKPALFFDPAVRWQFDRNGISGEMGLTLRDPDNFCRIRFYKGFGLVARKSMELGGLFFDAVVNNDSLNPTYTFEDVEKDQVFDETLREILRQAPALYLEMARSYRDSSGSFEGRGNIIRRHLLSWVNYVLGPGSDKPIRDDSTGASDQKDPETAQPEGPLTVKIIDEKFPGDNSWGEDSPGEHVSFTRRLSPGIEVRKITFDEPALTDLWKDLPLFPCVSGELASLRDLEKDMEKFQMVAYIRQASPGPRLDEKIVVVAEAGEEEILRKYFGLFKVINYEKGLQEERNSIEHLNRPCQEAVLDREAILKVPVDTDGITGEVGILPMEDASGSSGVTTQSYRDSRLRVKILKRHRFIMNKTAGITAKNAVAVINFDWLNTNQAWTDVVEDSLWNRVVDVLREGLASLALKCLNSFGELGTAQPDAMKFLKEFVLNHQDQIATDRRKWQESEFFRKLLPIPLFLTVNDSYVSIEQLEEEKVRNGHVAYVEPSFKVESRQDRLILRADSDDVDLIVKLLGNKAVKNIQEKLLDRELSEIVRKTRGQEEPEIPAGEVLFVRDISSGTVAGQIGLMHWKYAPSNNMSVVRFYRHKVPVIQRLVSLGLQVKAAVNCDELTVNRQWSNVAEDDKFSGVVDVLEESIEMLVEELADSFDSLSDEVREDGRLHLVAYITGRYRRFADVTDAPAQSLGGRIARKPLFPALGGKSLSLMDIIGFYKNFGKLLYVPRWTSRVPLDDDRVVIVCGADMLEYLRKMFVYCSDYSSHLDAEEKARKTMDDSEVRNLKVEGSSLLKVEIDGSGLAGELALPMKESNRENVKFCKKKVLVVEKPLYPGSSVIGVINSNQFFVNDAFTDVELYSREKRVLMSGVKQLYSNLVESFLRETDTRKLGISHRYLLKFYYQQKHTLSSEYRVMDDPLEERITNLALLPITDGRFVSLKVVFEMLQRLGYVPYVNSLSDVEGSSLSVNNDMKGPQGRNPDSSLEIESQEAVLLLEPGSYAQKFCQRVFGIDKLVHFHKIIQRREQERLVEEMKRQREEARQESRKLREDMDRRKTEGKKPSKKRSKKDSDKSHFSSGKEAPAPLIEPDNVVPSVVKAKEVSEEVPLASREDLSPEDRFLFTLKRELRIIREEGDYKLSEKVLKNMSVGYLEDKPMVMFNRQNNYLIINALDPAVGRIISGIDQEPQLLYYVLSVIYSTINRELLEITDEDELHFQMVMLDNLLKHPAFSGQNKNG